MGYSYRTFLSIVVLYIPTRKKGKKLDILSSVSHNEFDSAFETDELETTSCNLQNYSATDQR